jgi:TRAP-type mannitol/chloroaromatic compound transport system substrate-binding protein
MNDTVTDGIPEEIQKILQTAVMMEEFDTKYENRFKSILLRVLIAIISLSVMILLEFCFQFVETIFRDREIKDLLLHLINETNSIDNKP